MESSELLDTSESLEDSQSEIPAPGIYTGGIGPSMTPRGSLPSNSVPRGSIPSNSTGVTDGSYLTPEASLPSGRSSVSVGAPSVPKLQLDTSFLAQSHELDANGFGEDTDTHSPETPLETGGYQASDIKKAGELAAVFLESRKNFLFDNNIVETEPNGDNQTHKSISNISKATLLRAEKVKATIALKYLTISRICEMDQINYPGIEGVYNPLQIIRNRKLRAKYHEYPKPLSIKTLPLASTVFSNRTSGSRQKSKRFVWAIEIHELIGDLSWGLKHIHELKGPNGDILFPVALDSKNSQSKTSLHSKARKRLHDKLFLEELGDDTKSRRSSRSEDSNLPPSSDEDKRLLPISEIKTSRRSRLKKKVQKKLKQPFDSSSTNSSDASNVFKDKAGSSDQIEQFTKKLASDSEEAFLNVKIQPIDTKKTDDVDPVEIPVESKKGNNLIEQQLATIHKQQLYFGKATAIKLHYLEEVYPHLYQSDVSKIDHLTWVQIPDLNKLMIDINDDSIPAYELLCSTILNEIKSLMHVINDNYSVKVDNLLISSDRVIGEINTSMSLELRKLDDRIDKLNELLFRNKFSTGVDNKKITMKESDHKILYSILENFIVVLLRLIWVFATFYRLLKWLLVTAWKIIKFILF